MNLTLQDVKKIAHLARLELSDDALRIYQKQLTAVLTYAEKLNELSLDDVEPTAHAISQQNVMRQDQVQPSLSSEDIFYNAPQHQLHQFQIQTVLDDA